MCSIFFVIFRQSDKKGFYRWSISFKTAITFSAIAAGLIVPVNPELLGNNSQVYQERLLSDQEFNLFENNDQRVIFVKSSGEAEAFPVTPINKPGQNRNGLSLFGTGNGNGNPDDDPDDDPSNSNTPSSDFKENRKENRAESKNYEHQIYEKISDKDKDENSETDGEYECSIDEVKIGVANDGTFIHTEKSQVRDKGLHIPDFLDAETLDGKFDVSEAKNLEYLDRLKYLRDKNNLPDEIVIQARDEILDFMTADDTKLVPGFLGHRKIEGTVFINLRLNKVGFRDNNGYRFRTAMTMNDKKILELANRDFHLFPDAGKP